MQPTGAVFMSKGPKRPAFQTEETPEAIGLYVVGGLPLHHLAYQNVSIIQALLGAIAILVLETART